MVRGLLDERGIDRAILMGHSWGGTIMTAFAAAHPERVDGLVLVDSGQMDYQDAPGFPHGKSYEELVEDARAPERTIRTTAEDFERDAQEEVRRPDHARADGGLPGRLREEGGQLVSIVTPETRASAMYGLMGTRVTESWPAIAEAGLPILLLLATEPEETPSRTGAAACSPSGSRRRRSTSSRTPATTCSPTPAPSSLGSWRRGPPGSGLADRPGASTSSPIRSYRAPTHVSVPEERRKRRGATRRHLESTSCGRRPTSAKASCASRRRATRLPSAP